MTKIAKGIIAALTLAGSAMSAANAEPPKGPSKPSSFVPQHHSNGHIYGSPIERPILGHAKTSHRSQVHKQRPTIQ
jgi:hypothetical protein